VTAGCLLQCFHRSSVFMMKRYESSAWILRSLGAVELSPFYDTFVITEGWIMDGNRDSAFQTEKGSCGESIDSILKPS
jgi:hypothetical protein